MAFITNQLKISAQALWLKFYSFSMRHDLTKILMFSTHDIIKKMSREKNVNMFS